MQKKSGYKLNHWKVHAQRDLSNKLYEIESHSVVPNSLRPHGLYSPWNSLGQNTGVGSFSLLQGIFPTQELNWGLLHCKRILYQLSYQGSPNKLHRARYCKIILFSFTEREYLWRNSFKISHICTWHYFLWITENFWWLKAQPKKWTQGINKYLDHFKAFVKCELYLFNVFTLRINTFRSFRIYCFKGKSSAQISLSCLALQFHELQHTRLPCPSPTPRVYSN